MWIRFRELFVCSKETSRLTKELRNISAAHEDCCYSHETEALGICAEEDCSGADGEMGKGEGGEEINSTVLLIAVGRLGRLISHYPQAEGKSRGTQAPSRFGIPKPW